MNLVALAILVGVLGSVVVRQQLRRGPPVWALFIAGGALMVLSEALPVLGALSALVAELPVLLFLVALFVFAADLEAAGALDHLARWLIGRARRVERLPFVLFVGFGLLSAFVVNDALVLLGVPLLLVVARRVQAEAKPLILTLAFAVTVGSAMTPLGNPQNLLVSLSSGISAPIAVFLRYLLVPTLLNLLLGGYYLERSFGHRLSHDHDAFERVRAAAPPLFPPGDWGRRFREHPSLWVFPATLATLLGVSIASFAVGAPEVPIDEIALVGAGVVLLLGRHRVLIVRGVDWTIIGLFAGLFVVVAGAVAGGVVGELDRLLPIPSAGNTTPSVVAIVGTSLVGTQLVSNVPWVALQIPLLHGLGYGASTPVAWLALSAGSTLAGSITLLAAASNLIVVERADREGIHIGLVEFARYGAPLAGITLTVLTLSLILGLWGGRTSPRPGSRANP